MLADRELFSHDREGEKGSKLKFVRFSERNHIKRYSDTTKPPHLVVVVASWETLKAEPGNEKLRETVANKTTCNRQFGH